MSDAEHQAQWRCVKCESLFNFCFQDEKPIEEISTKNVTFIQKWHIYPKMAHSSKNVTLIQKCHIHGKCHIYQKMAHSTKMAHSSKNGIYIPKRNIPPKMFHSTKKRHNYQHVAHLSKKLQYILRKSKLWIKFAIVFSSQRKSSKLPNVKRRREQGQRKNCCPG